MYVLNGFLLFVSQGQYGIICLEDLIHEIYSAGKNFKVVNRFLCPFQLSVPRHAARDKAGLMKDVGDPGPRAENINTVIRKLNWANGLSWTAVLSPSDYTNKKKRTSPQCHYNWIFSLNAYFLTISLPSSVDITLGNFQHWDLYSSDYIIFIKRCKISLFFFHNPFWELSYIQK